MPEAVGRARCRLISVRQLGAVRLARYRLRSVQSVLQVLLGKRGFPLLRGELHSLDLREHQVLGIRDPRSLVGNPGFIAGPQEG